MQYKGVVIYTLKKEDIGKRLLKDNRGKLIMLSGIMGYVLALDVGKQLISYKGVISVESGKQRDARKGA